MSVTEKIRYTVVRDKSVNAPVFSGLEAIEDMTQEQHDSRCKLAMREIKTGKYRPASDVFRDIMRKGYAKV